MSTSCISKYLLTYFNYICVSICIFIYIHIRFLPCFCVHLALPRSPSDRHFAEIQGSTTPSSSEHGSKIYFRERRDSSNWRERFKEVTIISKSASWLEFPPKVFLYSTAPQEFKRNCLPFSSLFICIQPINILGLGQHWPNHVHFIVSSMQRWLISFLRRLKSHPTQPIPEPGSTKPGFQVRNFKMLSIFSHNR